MPEKSNVIFLYGNDELAMARRLVEFGSIFPDPTSAEMNTARLEARTMREDELNNAVNAMPFLAKQRLVLLANPSERYSTPPSRKKFFTFIEKVPLQTQLVIYENVEVKTYRNKAKESSEDEKHWLVKWIKKAGLGLERYPMPALWEMTGWIISYAKEQGGGFDQAAATKLAEMVGADTRQGAQEVTKLLTYVNWARPVKVQDVEEVSLLTAEPDIFAMVDALASGGGSLAQKLLHRLMENGDPFSVWGMVVRQFRLLLLAREVIEAHGGPREVEQALHVHAFVAEKVFGQAKHFSLPVLEKIYHRLLEIDVSAKTGQVTLDLALEILVVELTV
jgi:DNA polymerase III subunit delta